ncbi:hypothetical protein MTO96_039433 [Rhipicephalus appendiculatus]
MPRTINTMVLSSRLRFYVPGGCPICPREDIKVVIRPRGGLDIAKVGAVVVADAIIAAAGISSDNLHQDTLCPNMQQNIMVASTPKRKNAVRYVRIREIIVAGKTHELSAYEAAPHFTCKGRDQRRGERARAARSKSPAASPPPDLAFGGNLEFPAMTSGTEADSQGRSGSRDHSRARGRSRSRGGRSRSRGRSKSRAEARSLSRARSKTGSSTASRQQKPALSWTDKVRTDNGEPAKGAASSSQQSGPSGYAQELERLRKENAQLRKENAQVKEEMKKMANEIAEIKKFTLGQASNSSPGAHSHGGAGDIYGDSGASKRRAIESKQNDATGKTLAAMEELLAAMQSSLSQIQIALSDPQRGLVAINERIERLESAGRTAPSTATGPTPDMRLPRNPPSYIIAPPTAGAILRAAQGGQAPDQPHNG